jgi:molybdate transport system ATP-binding protein
MSEGRYSQIDPPNESAQISQGGMELTKNKLAEALENKKPVITVENITVRLRDRLILENSSWEIKADEHWAILGPNGSGKSTLVRSLWGGAPLRSGRILFHFSDQQADVSFSPQRNEIGYVSFETHQRLMEHEELQEDLREYAGRRDEVTTAQKVILSGILANQDSPVADEQKVFEVADLLGIRHLLQRGITFLSTGEIRKTLIARALIKSPRLLILDEPFDGLDDRSRASLAESINQLMTGAMRVILVAHRIEEVVPNITHVLFVKNGQIFMQGPKGEIVTSKNISLLYDSNLQIEQKGGAYGLSYGMEEETKIDPASVSGGSSPDLPDILVEMKNTTVRYGDHVILDHLNWTVRRGENWAILGPNGSGKSTILELILGDNLQGYSNEITLFGKSKGSGETLWEIRNHTGVISSEFQIQYRKKMSAYDVIASGFYNSIGLYQYPTPEQRRAVERWVEILAVRDIVKESYQQLSYGQKRMILLARAMVKSPILLILDEPCHGLDIPNRRRILKIIEMIGRTQTNLLYVTNQKEDILDCITHIMLLQKGKVLSQGKKENVSF